MSLTEPLLDLDLLEKEGKKEDNNSLLLISKSPSSAYLGSRGSPASSHFSARSEPRKDFKHRFIHFLVDCSPEKAPKAWFCINSFLLSWASLSLVFIVVLLLSDKEDKESTYHILKRTDLLYEITVCITWFGGATCSFLDVFVSQDNERSTNKLVVSLCESIVAIYFVGAAFVDLRTWDDNRPTSDKIRDILLDVTMDMVFFCAGFISTGYMSFSIFREEREEMNNGNNILFHPESGTTNDPS